MIKVGVLTSSRADFGIYLPLLKKIKGDKGFQLDLIVFGSHLSRFHGYTLKNIKEQGFEVKYIVESMLIHDSPDSVASGIGLSVIKFSDFWNEHKDKFDVVLCLGDRFEMYSAVIAGLPFQIPFAHFHGGEITLGAIDNVFRDCISLASKFHFASTEEHSSRLKRLLNHSQNIYNIGALSLDNLSEVNLLSVQGFNQKWGIDLNLPTILITFHPETVNYQQTPHHIEELIQALKSLEGYQCLISLPNMDTSGTIIREALFNEFNGNTKVFLVENLGTESYFTALKYCSFVLGNSSSGIIEAASFGKYVINIGDRQKGRSHGDNVLNVPIKREEILKAVRSLKSLPALAGENIYFKGGAASKAIEILKRNYEGF